MNNDEKSIFIVIFYNDKSYCNIAVENSNQNQSELYNESIQPTRITRTHKKVK